MNELRSYSSPCNPGTANARTYPESHRNGTHIRDDPKATCRLHGTSIGNQHQSDYQRYQTFETAKDDEAPEVMRLHWPI